MISKHVSMQEGIRSVTAMRLGVENKPGDNQLEAMKLIAEKIFEPLREWVGGPIKINSFFRSVTLNNAIGGSSNSQHCKGQAMDIDDTYGNKSNKEMFEYIKANLDYDQMIWEFGTKDNPAWVHVSYVSTQKNRRKCLEASRVGNTTRYKEICQKPGTLLYYQYATQDLL